MPPWGLGFTLMKSNSDYSDFNSLSLLSCRSAESKDDVLGDITVVNDNKLVTVALSNQESANNCLSTTASPHPYTHFLLSSFVSFLLSPRFWHCSKISCAKNLRFVHSGLIPWEPSVGTTIHSTFLSYTNKPCRAETTPT